MDRIRSGYLKDAGRKPPRSLWWQKALAGPSYIWNMALDLGWKAVMGLQMLSRAMGHHG